MDRFFREARAAAKVNHPNLIHVYFVGTATDGRPFFAMECVKGKSLDAYVEDKGPLSVAESVDLLVQSARGLAAAHDVGVIHRDVKPSNLMREPNGTVKVTDFGLAKSLDADVEATGGGQLTGTPTYMSPEQCKGQKVDARTDVYGLGLTAFYLLAGHGPYNPKTLGALINDQINTPLPSIADERAEVSRAVDGVLAKLCAKDSPSRPADMRVVVEMLEELRPQRLDLATIAARGAALAADFFILFVLAMACLFALELLGWFTEEVWDVLTTVLIVTTQFGAEAWQGRTIGKSLFNLCVVADDGTAPRRTRLFWRFLLRFPIAGTVAFSPITAFWHDVDVVVMIAFVVIQFLAMAAGFVGYLALGGKTISDILTRTRVVYRSHPAGDGDEEDHTQFA